jgi:hypothetical protein
MKGCFDNNELSDQLKYTKHSSPYFTNAYNNSCLTNLFTTSIKNESYRNTSESSPIGYTSQKNMDSWTLPPTSMNRYDNKSEKKVLFGYTSQNLILLKSAIKNTMVKKGGEKALLAESMIIKAKRTSKKECFNRRVNFKTQPSRLSVMSDARDNIDPVVTIMYSAS